MNTLHGCPPADHCPDGKLIEHIMNISESARVANAAEQGGESARSNPALFVEPMIVSPPKPVELVSPAATNRLVPTSAGAIPAAV